jgi:hypothetical protein
MRSRTIVALSKDTHGLPLALRVVEHRARLFSPGGESVHRSTIDVRPAGMPGTHRPPLLRSPACEETHLLFFLCGPSAYCHLGVHQVVRRRGREWGRFRARRLSVV